MPKPNDLKTILALILACPYIFQSIRIEHILPPLICLIYFIKAIFHKTVVPKPVILAFLGLNIGWVGGLVNIVSFEDTTLDANPFIMLHRVISPIFIMISLLHLLSSNHQPVITSTMAITIVGFFAGVISLCDFLFDIKNFLSYWVYIEDDSVWSQSRILNRFQGIFNQPLEAGVFFSAALLSIIYQFKIKSKSKIYNLTCFTFILIGGLLSLSKNFIILGIILSIIFAISIDLIPIYIGIIIGLLSLSSCLLLIFTYNEDYAYSFVKLFDEGNWLLALTAGRMGGDTEVSMLMDQIIINNQIMFGFGFGSHLPLDNGYLEYLYQGGVFSLAGYLLFILSFFPLVFQKTRDSSNKNLLLYLLLYIIAASFGGPTITANRANIAIMLLITSCTISIQRDTLSFRQKQRKSSER
jgi:hypothetical protein